MSNSWLGTAINATVNTAGIITNAIQARKQREANIALQRETNKQNLLLAREQNQWNERMIDEMNQYNTPANQRKLLEDAGYNPAMYSPDGMNQGTTLASANLANQVSPQWSFDMTGINQALSSLSNNGYMYLENKRLEKETERIASDTDRIKSDTQKIKADTKLSEENAKLVAIDIDKTNEVIENLRETRKSITQSILESKSRTDLNYSNITKNINDIDISRKQYQLASRSVDANISKIFSDIKVNDEKIKEIRQNIIVLGRDAVLKGKQITFQDINNIYREIETVYLSQEKETELKKMSADIYKSLTGELNRTVNTFIGDILTPLRNYLYGPSQTSGQYQKSFTDNMFNNLNYTNKQY